jgi:hypothetical protein
MTETWLGSDAVWNDGIMNQIVPESYDYLQFPREGKKGGGIAIIYSKLCSIKSVNVNFSPKSFECLVAKLCINSWSALLVVIYRPPNCCLSSFYEEFSELCELFASHDEFIALGDFNLDIVPNMIIPLRFQHILTDFKLIQSVVEATHVKGKILDLLITRSGSHVLNSISVKEGLSDHLRVDFLLNIPQHTKRPTISYSFRKISAINMPHFKDDLQSKVCQPIFHTILKRFESLEPNAVNHEHPNFCDDIFSKFDQSMRANLNEHAPLQHKTRVVRLKIMWWTTSLQLLKSNTRKCERHWRQTETQENRLLYIKAKHQYCNAISAAKRLFLENKLNECEYDGKKMWTVLTNAIGKKTKQTSLPDHDNNKILAAEFNNFFLTKVRNLCCNFCAKASPSTGLQQVSVEDNHLLTDFRMTSEKEIKELITQRKVVIWIQYLHT